MKVKSELVTQPAALEILAVAAKAFDPTSNDEVFIVFIDNDRNTQIIPFINSEDVDGEISMCFEEINEGLNQSWRPICVLVGTPDGTGGIEYVNETIPFNATPSIDDQAIIWSLTEPE